MSDETPKAWRQCPLCAAPGRRLAFPYTTRWNAKRFSYVACSRCGCTFVDPLPSGADFEQMYSRQNYHSEHYEDVGLDAYVDSVEFLRSQRGGVCRLLDFGAGTGAFLAAARLAGFDCEGVEYHQTAIQAAERYSGARVRTAEEMRASRSLYDVIHLGDVFEHLPHPTQTLKLLEQSLVPGGSFFLEGPLQRNASLVYYLSGLGKYVRRRIGVDREGDSAPTHLILVNSTAQRRFLEKAMNYKCIIFETIENGWPYLSRRPTGGVAGVIKRAIGNAAITAAQSTPGRLIGLGNRFRALYRIN